jgi:hypothetical protein
MVRCNNPGTTIMSGLFSLTGIHTLISLIAVLLGILAIAGINHPSSKQTWAVPFIVLAVATTLTGFLFPLAGFTPAVIVGIVSSVILIAVLAARWGFSLSGRWRGVYILGMVASLYLLVFVTIAQAFDKIPTLNALAPTGTEPPFAIAQIICLLVFVYVGFRAFRARNLA